MDEEAEEVEEEEEEVTDSSERLGRGRLAEEAKG
jgi:hypothetical protein